jgi:hypothetical protein
MNKQGCTLFFYAFVAYNFTPNPLQAKATEKRLRDGYYSTLIEKKRKFSS